MLSETFKERSHFKDRRPGNEGSLLLGLRTPSLAFLYQCGIKADPFGKKGTLLPSTSTLNVSQRGRERGREVEIKDVFVEWRRLFGDAISGRLGLIQQCRTLAGQRVARKYHLKFSFSSLVAFSLQVGRDVFGNDYIQNFKNNGISTGNG